MCLASGHSEERLGSICFYHLLHIQETTRVWGVIKNPVKAAAEHHTAERQVTRDGLSLRVLLNPGAAPSPYPRKVHV